MNGRTNVEDEQPVKYNTSAKIVGWQGHKKHKNIKTIGIKICK